jgi:hypothetical protein
MKDSRKKLWPLSLSLCGNNGKNYSTDDFCICPYYLQVLLGFALAKITGELYGGFLIVTGVYLFLVVIV